MSQSRKIVFPLYAGVTQLDFTGPFEVLRRIPGAECVCASFEGGTLEVGPGLRLTGLVPLSEIGQCWLLCVPGGYGCVTLLGNRRFLAELGRLGASGGVIGCGCHGIFSGIVRQRRVRRQTPPALP